MIPLQFDKLRTILCLGAHADDIEIGCGGALLKLLDQHTGLRVCWVVMSGGEERQVEARRSAERFLAAAGEREIRIEGFRDSFFPYQGEQIKEYFRALQGQLQPDLIFTHRRDDAHQDHRTLAELTWNTYRNHAILEYEIPKYEGDLGQPNLFVTLDEATCRRKVDVLAEEFASQRGKGWFDADTFWALLRLRGVECQSPTRFAEGFYSRKLVV